MVFDANTIAIITAVIALLGTLWTARVGMPAHADDMAAAFSKLNDEIRRELDAVRQALEDERQKRVELEQVLQIERDKMHRERQALSRRLTKLQRGVNVLIKQLEAANIEPAWKDDEH